MTTFVERIDFHEALNLPAENPGRRLLEIWQSTGGALCDELIPLESELVTLAPPDQFGAAPQILLCGARSFGARLLGQDWADNTKAAVTSFDQSYTRLVSNAYSEAAFAFEPAPICEVVTTPLLFKGTGAFRLKYQRLIAPFSGGSNRLILFCYSMDLDSGPAAKDRDKDEESPHGLRQQSSGHAGRFARAADPRSGNSTSAC